MRTLFFPFSILLFFIPALAHAQVVISEVMWMGSDLSTSDEWLEIAAVPCSEDCSASIDLSGWRITYLNSKGEEALVLRFATGTSLMPASPMVIASRSAENSRLRTEPAVVLSSLTLPNTKLLLRLYDRAGTLLDTVDDGIGAPFAGANPSGTGAKASMQRVDLQASGDSKENWRTAEVAHGFDAGFQIFGTPGSLYETLEEVQEDEEIPAACSESSEDTSHCGTTVEQTGAVLELSSQEEVNIAAPITSSDPASQMKDACKESIDGLVSISELLPNPVGDDTLYEFIELKNYSNYSIILCGLSIDTGEHTTRYLLDDYILNPHAIFSFERPRTKITLGNEKGRVRLVSSLSGSVKVLDDVAYDEAQEGWSYARTDGGWWTWTKSPTLGAKNRFDTGLISLQFHTDGVILSAVLPNAATADSTSEWVELKNTTSQYRSLLGWKIFDTKSKKSAMLDNFGISPGATLRLWSAETKLQLSNAGGKIELYSPDDTIISTVEWPEAKEGSIYHASEFFADSISATSAVVLDGDTFIAAFDESFERKFGFRETKVRLIGIDAPELAHDGKKAEQYASEAKEMLRALIEGKNIELEFGSEKYDSYARLLAYVRTDDGEMAQMHLLKSGLVEALEAFPHSKLEEFLSFEKMAKSRALGIWSAKIDSMSGALSTLLPEPKNFVSSGIVIQKPSLSNSLEGKIVITEVYAAPLNLGSVGEKFVSLSLEKDTLSLQKWKETEWVELKNLSRSQLNLNGWKIGAGTGSKLVERFIDEESSILPGSYALLDISELKLRLRNDGAFIVLLSPDGVRRSTVTYPKLSSGQSYARRSAVSSRFCITESPTPFKDTRCTAKVKKRKGK